MDSQLQEFEKGPRKAHDVFIENYLGKILFFYRDTFLL